MRYDGRNAVTPGSRCGVMEQVRFLHMSASNIEYLRFFAVDFELPRFRPFVGEIGILL